MCALSVQHMALVCVCAGVRSLAFVCIMLWPTQVLRPQRKSTANNSTATGKQPYHPRGLWDRVYNQRWSVGGWNQKGSPYVMQYSIYCPLIPHKTLSHLATSECLSPFSEMTLFPSNGDKTNARLTGSAHTVQITPLIPSITLMQSRVPEIYRLH